MNEISAEEAKRLGIPELVEALSPYQPHVIEEIKTRMGNNYMPCIIVNSKGELNIDATTTRIVSITSIKDHNNQLRKNKNSVVSVDEFIKS